MQQQPREMITILSNGSMFLHEDTNISSVLELLEVSKQNLLNIPLQASGKAEHPVEPSETPDNS